MANQTDALQIARRYATAMFAVAQEAGKEAILVSDMNAFRSALEQNALLRDVLNNPLITREIKSEVLVDLGSKADQLTVTSLAMLAKGGRADLIPQVAQELNLLLAAQRGEILAEVTSARPLAAAVKKQLEDALKNATGKIVKLVLQEDPELLGGMIVQIGSQRLDASLSGALNEMRVQLNASATTTY